VIADAAPTDPTTSPPREKKERRTCGRRSRLGRHTSIDKQNMEEP
jgi:hypothetical protein